MVCFSSFLRRGSHCSISVAFSKGLTHCQYASKCKSQCNIQRIDWAKMSILRETLLLAKGILIDSCTNGIHNIWFGRCILLSCLSCGWSTMSSVFLKRCSMWITNHSLILSNLSLVLIMFVVLPHSYQAALVTRFCSTSNSIILLLWPVNVRHLGVWSLKHW